MKPVGIDYRKGKWDVIRHKCQKCAKEMVNIFITIKEKTMTTRIFWILGILVLLSLFSVWYTNYQWRRANASTIRNRSSWPQVHYWSSRLLRQYFLQLTCDICPGRRMTRSTSVVARFFLCFLCFWYYIYMSLLQTRFPHSSQWLEQIFWATYSKYVKKEDILILAVSGGVDSMVLLDLILSIHPKDKIIVAHFDHSLRWAESDGDRDFIANLCKNENITFDFEKLDIATLALKDKMSIESAARKYRYDFLFFVARKNHAKFLLTAHHQDDRIETAIFNLLRGTKLGGIHALSEISQSTDDITLFRPLLSIPKKEILDYAQEKHIWHREDSSNLDTSYLRNKLRHDIIPEFESINSEYRRAITNFIEYSEDLKWWIDDKIKDWLKSSGSRFQSSRNKKTREINTPFSILDFQGESIFFQREIIRYLYERENDGTIWLSEWLIDELIRFITQGSNSSGIREVKKLHLERRGDWIQVISVEY